MKKRYFRRPHRIKEKEPIFKNRLFWGFLSFLFILIGVFYLFVFSAFFQVKSIKVIGGKTISIIRLQNLVRRNIKKNIIFFSTKSIVLVNFGSLSKTILREFPQIDTIKFRRVLPNSLQILIKERIPICVWCNKLNKCFLVDKKGVAFGYSSNASTSRQTIEPTIKFFEEKKVHLGDVVVNPNRLKLILDIQKKLKAKKIIANNFIFVSPVDLKIQTKDGWFIYLNPKKDIDWQITELVLVLEKKISPVKKSMLKYIDLRFDKVFVFPENVLMP